MTPAEVERIVNMYGAVLGEQTAIGVIRDINSLPYPKAQIKEALQYAMRITPDKVMRNHFKAAYIALSDFQESSDAEILVLQKWNGALGKSSGEMSMAELRQEAKAVADVGNDVMAVQDKSTCEAHALAEELNAAGF